MMKVIIDRFEGEFAIVEIEEGKFTSLPKIVIPNAQEGDVIEIKIDEKETKHRKEKIKNLMDDLFVD